MRADITIDGRGFYQIVAQTARGQRFMRQVQEAERGIAYCDDTRLTQNIADGAVDAGLRVAVNGAAYRV